MPRESLTPLSILIGSAIIGAGLYFGLRERGEAAPSNPPAVPSAASAVMVSAAPTFAPPPRATTAPDAVLRERVAADAAIALQSKHARLRAKCWAPALAKEPLPAAARYVFDVTFDAAGTEIGRGISEVRGASRSDVAQCLRSLPMDLIVPPPGTNVGVQVTLDFR